MNCNQCGADVPDQAAFCPQCGAQLDRVGAADESRPAGAARLQAGGGQGSSRDVPEEELWNGAYSPKAMTGAFILAALLTILGMIGASFAGPAGWVAVVIGALILFGYLGLLMLYKRMSVHYRLTTHRLVLQRGILSRTDDRILLVDIDDITVQQSLINRMFQLGTITLNTKDETSPVLVMPGIENPHQVGDLIDEARRTERTRRGVYMMNA